MSVMKSIGVGIGVTFRRRRVLVYLWAINIVYALALAAPLLMIVQKELGHSLAGSSVKVFDISWLGEMIYKYQDALPALAAGLAIPALMYILLFVFLNGGLVGRLLDREGPATLSKFFSDCGRYFGRFFRLFLISLLFYAVLFGGLLGLVGAAFRPWLEAARTEWPLIVLPNLRLLIGLLLLSIVHMVFDYARIVVVADAEARSLRALRLAFGFLKKRFFRAWGLYLLIVMAFLLAGSALGLFVSGRLAGTATPVLILGFLWAQIMVVFRLWIKALFFAAQAEFYRMHPY